MRVALIPLILGFSFVTVFAGGQSTKHRQFVIPENSTVQGASTAGSVCDISEYSSWPFTGGNSIPDNCFECYKALTNVQGNGNVVLDVIVELTINHGWSGDLIVDLVHDDERDGVDAGDTRVSLLCRPGLPGCDGPGECCGCSTRLMGYYYFSDAASTFLAEPCSGGVAPSGCYRPAPESDPLSVFDGVDKDGFWWLLITDGAEHDVGEVWFPTLHILEAAPPICGVEPSTIDFGHASAPTDSSFTITNAGGVELTGSVSTSCADFAILSGGGPFTLQPAESRAVDLRFDPQAEGYHYCSIDFLTNGQCGPIAYVADRSGGMNLFDISDPTNPQLISNWSGVSYAVALKDGHAVVAHGGKWVRFVNVVVPTYPYQVNSRDIGCCTRDVAILGDYAYVARSETLAGLQIFRVTDLPSVDMLGTYLSTDSSWKVDVQGDHAYLASSSEGLEIINVTDDPSNPWREGQHIGAALTYGVDVVGDLAYLAVAGEGLEIVNVADPANPYHVGGYVTGSSANDVVVRHGIAYLVSSISAEPAALTIVDVSDPSNPVELSELTAPYTLDAIELFAGYAYIGATTAGLWIVDVSDPTNPSVAATYDTPGDARGVAIGGGVELTGFMGSPTAVEAEPSLAFALDAGNPNPFGTDTTIRFSLDRPGPVEVIVYDVAGRRVRTVVKRDYPPGRHFVQWDGLDDARTGVVQGLYLVRLSDRSRTLTRKIMHVR